MLSILQEYFCFLDLKKEKKKKKAPWGARVPQAVQHAILDLGVMNSNPTLGKGLT